MTKFTCRMLLKGVTPIPARLNVVFFYFFILVCVRPVAMRTACWAWKMLLAGAPKGPSIWTWN